MKAKKKSKPSIKKRSNDLVLGPWTKVRNVSNRGYELYVRRNARKKVVLEVQVSSSTRRRKPGAESFWVTYVSPDIQAEGSVAGDIRIAMRHADLISKFNKYKLNGRVSRKVL